MKLLLTPILYELDFPQSDFFQVTVDLYHVTLVMGEVNHTLHALLLGH